MSGHDRVAAMVGSLSIPAVAVDRDTRVVAFNKLAERTFGLDEASSGRRLAELGGPLGGAEVLRALEQVRTGRCPAATLDVAGVGVRCRVARPLGALDMLLLTADEPRARTAADAEVAAAPTGVDTAGADPLAASEQLRAANEALQAKVNELRDALEISRHKDDFLAMLAHELRNPLAPILSATQVIRRHPDNGEVIQRAREIIERQVRHQARLLDDLLDVSRITRGRIRLRKASLDMRSAVSAAVEATRPLITARNHTLTVVLPDAPLLLDADPTRLTQIITNLMDNAAKYTDPGGAIEVSARREGDDIVLAVQDTGIGIPHDMQARVFELFTQVDVPIARSLGGLGLGLSLVRSLAELHGGSATVTSDGPGRGSTFTIRLPVGAAEARTGAAPPAPVGVRHVLVIEDNADAREMLRIALELDGHRVETAADGVTGVETALRSTPDLVLVDIGLPELDGYAVARRLRAALGARVTLVALTGYGQTEDRRRASEAGFDAHLVKPVDPDVLSRALATGFPLGRVS